jgi:hypothetical protein
MEDAPTIVRDVDQDDLAGDRRAFGDVEAQL